MSFEPFEYPTSTVRGGPDSAGSAIRASRISRALRVVLDRPSTPISERS